MSKAVDAIKAELGDDWVPRIYQDRVRSDRTRAYTLEVGVRENRAEIQYTLLGIELKVGRRRFSCPELATARYLRVFARIGVSKFAIPYDISQISAIADEFETGWHRSLLMLEKRGGSRTSLIRAMRDEITAIGPGEPMPLFDRETRQKTKSEKVKE
ncbi:MAG: hypothetical protein WBD16_05695 [Pyrinomonadaceae bacterium]